MKKWGTKFKPPRIVKSELTTKLGEGNTIFIGSSIDMFATEIPIDWISTVFAKCKEWPKNKYLFQSKNPGRFLKIGLENFPENSIFGTTIESNQFHDAMGAAPEVKYRAVAMSKIMQAGANTMITIEPVMDFDLLPFTEMIRACYPDWVNIGANTNSKVKLQEPSRKKVDGLIKLLKDFTKVKIKSNLNKLK